MEFTAIPTRTRTDYVVSIGSFKHMSLVLSDEMSVATEWLRKIRPLYAVHNQNNRMVVGLSIDDAYVTLFIGKHGICLSMSKLPPQIRSFLEKPKVIFAGYNIHEKKERLRETSGVVVGRVLELKKSPAPIGVLPVEGPPVGLHLLAADLMGSVYGIDADALMAEGGAELKSLFLKSFQSFFLGKELLKEID